MTDQPTPRTAAYFAQLTVEAGESDLQAAVRWQSRANQAESKLRAAAGAGLRRKHSYDSLCSPQGDEFEDPYCYCDRRNALALAAYAAEEKP